jgi:hypothetical protein
LVTVEGHFVDVAQLFCPTDEEAIKQAHNLAAVYAVELWERDRLIAFIPPLTS